MQRNRTLIPALMIACLLVAPLLATGSATTRADEPLIVVISTNYGKITVELEQELAPITVGNFVNYTNAGFFEGLIYHRVIDDFMIQGGGFYRNSQGAMVQKTPIFPAIPLEVSPQLTHEDGAIAMARTSDPNSATSQFFINDGAQHFLEASSSSDGYAVFGYVIDGMDVVRTIASVPTQTDGGHQDVPVEDVIINSVRMPDGQGPEVLSHAPSDNTTDVAINAGITVEFSDTIDIDSVRRNAVDFSPSVDFDLIWTNENMTLTIDPYSSLAYETTYTLTLTSRFSDLNSDPLENYTFSFTTEQAPPSTEDPTPGESDPSDDDDPVKDEGFQLELWHVVILLAGIALVVFLVIFKRG